MNVALSDLLHQGGGERPSLAGGTCPQLGCVQLTHDLHGPC